MRDDVTELGNFYAAPLGAAAGRILHRRLDGLWPDMRGMAVLGLGYAGPVLGGLGERAGRVVAAMPARQGAEHWPAVGPGRTVLTEEDALPFPDLGFDRVLLVHDIETAEHLGRRLREVWRILADDGRLAVVVPNRRGLWAWFDHTPFGRGRPYSKSQLFRLLDDSLFTVLSSREALFLPPLPWRRAAAAADMWERFGRFCPPVFGGVVVAEAAKRRYGTTPEAVGARARRRRLMPRPAVSHTGRPPSRSSPPSSPVPTRSCAGSRSP